MGNGSEKFRVRLGMGVEDGWVGVGIEGFAGDGVTTCSLYTLYIYT